MLFVVRKCQFKQFICILSSTSSYTIADASGFVTVRCLKCESKRFVKWYGLVQKRRKNQKATQNSCVIMANCKERRSRIGSTNLHVVLELVFRFFCQYRCISTTCGGKESVCSIKIKLHRFFYQWSSILVSLLNIDTTCWRKYITISYYTHFVDLMSVLQCDFECLYL